MPRLRMPSNKFCSLASQQPYAISTTTPVAGVVPAQCWVQKGQGRHRVRGQHGAAYAMQFTYLYSAAMLARIACRPTVAPLRVNCMCASSHTAPRRAAALVMASWPHQRYRRRPRRSAGPSPVWTSPQHADAASDRLIASRSLPRRARGCCAAGHSRHAPTKCLRLAVAFHGRRRKSF